jgi:hypothetical protein
LLQSEIPGDLIEAYRSAHYRVGSAHEAFVLLVNQYSERLSQLFNASGHRCAAFLTSCNPFGIRQNAESSRAACAALRNRLDEYVSSSDQIIEGTGSDPREGWSPEESFLVLGLDLEEARRLGREFRQNAIVWAGKGAIPKLILLR